jgi:hypothetical protein
VEPEGSAPIVFPTTEIFDARAAARIFVGVDYTHAVTACKKANHDGQEFEV